MDSDGTMYMPSEKKPKDAIPLDESAATVLASMNRKARRAYHSAIRHGAKPEEAMKQARATYPPR
jgi:hypothetical protein